MLKTVIKIEIPNPPMTDPNSYCRFCYDQASNALISIFPASDNPRQQRIIDLVDQLIGIKLTAVENFPSAVCGQCYCKLEEFDYFRRKCVIYSGEVIRTKASCWAEPESFGECKQEVLFPKSTDDDGNAVAASSPALLVEDNDGVTSKTRRFSWVKSGRTGPLMRKLNKLRGVKTKKPKSKPVEQKDYRCRACLRFFTDKDSINIHMRTHVDTMNVRCLQCSRSFETVQGLMIHMMHNYILTSFTCLHCDVLFKSKEELVAHELYCEKDKSKYQITEAPKAFRCDQCPKSYDTIFNLQKHVELHDPKLVCDKCGADFSYEFKLKNHYERYHSNGPEKLATVVKCQLCPRTFVDASAYRNHLTGFHPNEEQNLQIRKLDGAKLYECDHCGKRFWSINTIRYHVLVHRQYRDCDQCSESFRSRKELRDHKLAVHPVKCSFCPMTFFSKTSCRSHTTKKHGMVHIRLLAEEENNITYEWRKLVFKCASCEQDYEFYRELKDHYGKMHPGAQPLIKCSYCEKLSSSSRIGYLSHVTGNCGQTPRKVKAWH